MTPPARRPPPWLFGLLILPSGICATFGSTTVGRLLKLHGLREDLLAGAVALSIVPPAMQFLWAPLTDLWIRRRSWLALVTLGSAILVALSTLVPLPTHVGWFVALIVAAQLVSGLASCCCGGLMATTLEGGERGSAAGWYNAGNVGGGCIGGGVTLWMIGRGVPQSWVGAAAALMMALPAIAVLAVDEPPPAERAAGETFRLMLRGVWATVRSRAGWTGIVICLFPAGSAAAIGLFSSVPDEYAAKPWMVTMVTGFGGGAIISVGAILGGWATHRIRPRVAYLTSGALTAVCAVAMALSAFTPATYAWGALSYYFAAGLCYGTYTAVVLEVVGAQDAGASTRYTLFTAAANLAIAYVTWSDGLGAEWWGHRHGKATGPRGLLLTDAALNVLGIVALAILFRVLRRKPIAEQAASAG